MLTSRIITILAGITLSISSLAQDSLLLRDYRFVKQSDPWLTSKNAAGLVRCDLLSPIAEAEVAYMNANGGLINYDGAPTMSNTNAGIESIYRFSPRTVLSGGLSYEYFDGKEMGSSVFMPINTHRPFDIVEDSVTNLGKKHSDTYRLYGRFATDIWNGIAIGADINYTAANYAKYKDMRHQNKLVDMTLTAGIYAPLNSWCSVGANYVFRHNIESVRFGTYGKSDKVYKTLVDYANFTGMVEQFGNDGYTDKSREMPLVDDRHGLGIQLSLRPTKQTLLFGEFGYAHRKGYYGSHSPFTITYTDHHGDLFEYRAQLNHTTGSTRHIGDFYMNVENLVNEANTYRETKNTSGATSYEYFTPVKTANKMWMDYGLSYTLLSGIRHQLPTLSLQAGISRMKRKQTAYIYPFMRRQNISRTQLFANATYNLICSRGVWTLSLDGSLAKGKGNAFDDELFATPSSKQAPPPSMNEWLYQEYEYLTAAQYTLGAGVKYAFVFPGTRMKTHARLDIHHAKANETYTNNNGHDRTEAVVAIGCTF